MLPANISHALNGELNDEQPQSLGAIADQSPIYKLMASLSTEVNTLVR
ncbi:hypothetical protein [Marinomonas foliarum]|uniref:Uncharacterized protein n=1 Tax=Marinomonas foliarum TaxID=491950 RepID=A0ABX7INF1_9GAMM|nr:hypothetical protein [Marinomonas foliarum]QRV23469.1 hypothetical protein JSY38_15705 [Marinomonas foliarum]